MGYNNEKKNMQQYKGFLVKYFAAPKNAKCKEYHYLTIHIESTLLPEGQLNFSSLATYILHLYTKPPIIHTSCTLLTLLCGKYKYKFCIIYPCRRNFSACSNYELLLHTFSQ